MIIVESDYSRREKETVRMTEKYFPEFPEYYTLNPKKRGKKKK